jgi:tetratricopeptide (TPR) repeat protein
VPALRLAAAMSPLHEPVQASLMTVLAATGQQAEALAVFHKVRTRLAEELGIDPGAAVRSAHQRVLSQAAVPRCVPVAAAASRRDAPPDAPPEADREADPATDGPGAAGRLLQYFLHSSYHAQVLLEPNRPPIAPPPPAPGVLHQRPSSYDEAIAWFAGQRYALKEAVRLAADERHGVVPWQLALTMQQYLQWDGFFQDWEDIMRAALRSARERDDPVGAAHALRSLAGARWSLGASQEALSLLETALRVYEQREMGLEQALVHSNAYRVYDSLGRPGRALAHADRATALYRTLGHRRGEAFGFFARGKSLARLGDLEESACLLGQAIEANQEVGRRHDEGEFRIAIAANLSRAGRTEGAVDQLVMSVDISRAVGDRPNEFNASRHLAEALIDLGDTGGAVRALARTRELLGQFQGGGTEAMRAACARLARQLPAADDTGSRS